MRDTRELMLNAWKARTVIPAFNIPHLPMMEPIVRALREAQTVGLIAVARLEWMKFASGSVRAIYEEYQRVKDERYTRLHLDHVPVIDEDGQRVNYLSILREAAGLGYQSLMLDGSRLPLAENISATQAAVEIARGAGLPLEAELGAVLGHESGPLPPYEELFASGKGFTDPDEARRFVEQTGVDWLSVAVGNIHGAISGAAKDRKKPTARLNVQHLRRIARAVQRPLVLHGGSGIDQACILAGVREGIAKINIGTVLRQAYETASRASVAAGQSAVHAGALKIITEELEIAGSAKVVDPSEI